MAKLSLATSTWLAHAFGLGVLVALSPSCGPDSAVQGHAQDAGGRNASGSVATSGGTFAPGTNATAGSGARPAAGSGASANAGASSGRAGRGAAGATASAGRSGGAAGMRAGAGTGGLGSAGASGSASVGGSDSLAPAQGALLGLYYGDGNIAATMTKLGRTPPIHLVYWAWADDWAGSETKADLAAGRIPLVNWEPAGVDFNKIVSGSLDSTIMARANGAKALGKKFFLDFAAEMNGDEAWGGNNPTLYVAAYRHIHDIFTAAGATNVVWAWCPNVTDTNGGNSTTMDYYPGDAYVDWTGVDGYNWGSSTGDRWQTFQDVFTKIYALLKQKGKPIMIGEMASAEVGGNKGEWIDQMIPELRDNFPLIKAVIWFDVNKETDWRISSSPAAEAAFKRMANDVYFNP